MSYILNALKHSESQRNRGEIPHIDSQPEFVKVAPSRWGERAWRWAALLAVLGLLLGLAWARYGGDLGTLREALPVQPAVVDATSALSTTPSAAAVAPLPAAVAAPAAEQAPGLKALQGMEGVRISLGEAVQPSAPASAPSVPGPKVVLEMPVNGGFVPRERASLPPPVAITRSATEAPPAEVLNGVSHWKHLPPELQKQLRELAFTAHIYSSNPATRFIRVSGRTVHEGEPLSGELQLQQITRDGIVFAYHGEKYWRGTN